ncbi:hypothetical protein AUEXF2481DRAFT_7209 [Aureobasidium subglaciale EXF-2481]|uniref:Uncharacterized protein n=1 Tax=Aureobasidium subglaciale (strain EXF-2481) TaxID=1043005 RepID=A0A074Y4X6_AURSE|nr:uncharacterized protein AUEXF2481DRAFT_7209 [Aureobasidium subglaciale EXF-2481]KEQ92843.1 hypothetical protein AUEXF2481DRAFT_7209 [Aureobasidium subglaciale EXF-2481]
MAAVEINLCEVRTQIKESLRILKPEHKDPFVSRISLDNLWWIHIYGNACTSICYFPRGFVTAEAAMKHMADCLVQDAQKMLNKEGRFVQH